MNDIDYIYLAYYLLHDYSKGTTAEVKTHSESKTIREWILYAIEGPF